MSALAALSALAVIGQQLHAPDWLRERIATRIEARLGGMQIAFGDVNMVLQEGWRPRMRLRDVTLSDPQGQIVAQLADAEASLAMRPLLRGELQPKRISLSGVFASLRRDAGGNLSLSFGSDAAPLRRAESLGDLVEQLDSVFELPQFSSLVAVSVEALTLNYEDAGQGRAWTLDGGYARSTVNDGVLRLNAGFSLLGGRDYASSIEANYTSRIGEAEAEFGFVITDLPAEDVAIQNPAMAWLKVLRAPISGALRGGIDAGGQALPFSATLQIGAGVLQPNDGTRPVPFDNARSYFSFDPAEQRLVFDEISVASDWGAAQGAGQAYLDGVAAGTLDRLVGQFALTDIRVNPDGLYDEPLVLPSAGVDFKLSLDPFRLSVGQANLAYDERTLTLTGELAAEREGWKAAVDGQIDRITPAQVLRLWPGGLAPKPRKWVTENLIAAQVSDLDFSLRLTPGRAPALYADFDFAEATIRFAKHLPPLINAAGQASLLGRRFAVAARQGQVLTDSGDLVDGADSSFVIPDIGIRKAAPGLARIKARGNLRAALSLLDRPPFRIMEKAGLPVDLAEGEVTVRGVLAVPLKKGVKLGQMAFDFEGDLRGVETDRLVPGHVLRAPGLRISGDQTRVELAGPGFLGEVPVDVRWVQPIVESGPARSRVSGVVEFSPALLAEVRAGLPEGMVTGKGQADFTLDIGGGAEPELRAHSTLEGVSLALPELGWRKGPTETGELTLRARPVSGGAIDAIALEAAGLSAEGSVAFTPEGELELARFGRFSLGGWIDAAVDLVGSGRAVPDIRVLGGSVDMRRSPGSGGAGGSAGPGPRLQVALDRLQVTDSIALTGMRGEFGTGGGFTGQFRGLVNGQAPISGQVLARGGRSAVFLEADDAGSVASSAGILRQGRGGQLRMSLEPAEGDGAYEGRLRITDTRVQDLPAMAALLDAISVVGLLDEMTGPGIQFTEVDARFGISPGRIAVYEGSAVGPSVGLSMDGTIDTARGLLDLRGVVSPVYLLNAIGSVLTRKGEGVIGFNYRLAGSPGAPSVAVNPLSALTPGFFREIFRDAPPPREPGAAPPPPRVPLTDQRPGEDR